MLRLFQEFGAHSEYESGFDELWDLSELRELDLPASSLRKEVAKETRRRVDALTQRAAIVVTSPLLFGLARMYQTFSELEGNRLDIELFQSLELAKAWLGLPAAYDLAQLLEGIRIGSEPDS